MPGGVVREDSGTCPFRASPTTTEELTLFLSCSLQWQRPEVAERASQHPGPDGEVWQEWRWACRHPEVDFLDTLYIMSIRRTWTASTWVYFPEVEIRSP